MSNMADFIKVGERHETKTTPRKIIDLFLAFDSTSASVSLKGKKFGKKDMLDILTPKDAKKMLKKLILAGEPIRKNTRQRKKFDEKNKNLNAVFKDISKHKYSIAYNQVVQYASGYIVDVARVHHLLTFLMGVYVFAEGKGDNLEASPSDIVSEDVTLVSLLRDEKVKSTFDTDELTALRTFNYLRNSLVHSSSYGTFLVTDEVYLGCISNLLDDIDDIFMWLYNQFSFDTVSENKG